MAIKSGNGDSTEPVWGRRLESGPVFSCAPDWGPGQVLQAFWRDAFATVKPGIRVLEIGCGAGDVSIWAAEAGRGLKIVASDLHSTAQGVRQHPDVTFIGNARAESLPVPDESFDLVVSNFAIEYAQRSPAISEIVRVLRPGGEGIFVMHSSDSTITATSQIAIRTYEALVRATVPERVHRAAGFSSDHPSRRKLLKEVAGLRQNFQAPRLSFSGFEYFDVAERMLRSDPAARKELARVDEGVAMRLDISREQSRVALDQEGLAGMQREFNERGVAMHISEMTCTYENSVTEKVGWIAFLAKRPRG